MSTCGRLVRKQVILAKNETVYGTIPVLSAASNAFNAGPIVVNPDVRFDDRPNVVDEINQQAGFAGRFLWRTQFTVEVKSYANAVNGDSLTPHPHDPILRAMGFKATYTPESSAGANDGFVVYTPASKICYPPATGDPASVGMHVYLDDVVHKIAGAYGTATLNFPAGTFPVMECDFTGMHVEDPDDEANPTPTLETDLPQKVASIGATFTPEVGSPFTGIIESISLDIGNTIPERPDVNSPEGLFGLLITERNTVGSFNPEAPTMSDFNPFTQLRNGFRGSMSFTVGTGDGKRVTVTLPKAQFNTVGQAERNGVLVYDIGFRATPDDSDDHMELKFH